MTQHQNMMNLNLADDQPVHMKAQEPGFLASLVASRLCHDLISPLGAIGNGVELLSMPPMTGAHAGSGPELGSFGGGAGSGHFGPELQLISESVENAKARIRLFRVAFGLANPDQRMGRPEIAAILDDVDQAGRLSFDWQVEGDHARLEIKMVMLAILCLETALPRGGRVLICRAGSLWRLIAEASRTKPDPALWQWLARDPQADPQPPAQITPALVQFALLPAEAAQAGRQIQWEIDETGAEICF